MAWHQSGEIQYASCITFHSWIEPSFTYAHLFVLIDNDHEVVTRIVELGMNAEPFDTILRPVTL